MGNLVVLCYRPFGLRQGDHLSPFLFLLCAKVFTTLLGKEKKKAVDRLLQGMTICDWTPIINHLLFADDILLFWKATLEECMTIKSI